MLRINVLPKVCKCGSFGPFRAQKRGAGGLTSECVVCLVARHKAWYDSKDPAYKAARGSRLAELARQRYATDPKAKARMVATAKAWRARNRGKVQHARRRRRYGMVPGEFDRMLLEQEGRCACCGDEIRVELGQKNGGVAVDHDHATNRVRALLCHLCNKGLGSFKDDPERLAKAIAYLAKHGGK